jgi:thioesterase domain-containing protein/acyl carrier protein
MTGDLGSLSADGCLTHKGRKDFRAKIRGVRVEVEEVEATLSQHPSVRQAVVSTHHDQAGQHRLLAYIVLRPGAQETDAEMRAFLLRRLPDPMIPSGFVFVDALPLSPHGKVDRHALPLPNATRPRRDPNAFALPADELEQTLIRMCETVLKVQPIGKDENLFDLGIDSLTVLRLIAEIERKFEKHLPPAALFSTPTITELAVLLRNEPIRSWSSLVPIQTTGNKPPFFWIHGDYSSVPLSRALGPDQPFYVLEHQAQDGTTAAFTRVETIAGYYLNEIQKVQVEGPYYIGGYSFGGVVALEVAQRMIKLGEQVGLVALLDPPTVAKESGRSSQGSVAVGEARASAHEAFRRHFDNLTALPAGERMAYLQPRARNKVVKMLKLALIERFAKRLTYRTCLALGYRLPVLVRSQYILDIYGRARRAYAAQAYSGRVILFKGEARRYNPQSDWEDLMVGDLDVHVVNANHAQIREEAYVHLWANTLKQALTQAQVHASLTTPDLRVGT